MPSGKAYHQAFNIAIVHSDVARARVFAERAVSAATIPSGNGSLEVQILTGLAKDPCQHELYGTSQTWRATVDDIPKDLYKEVFERWLWRKQIVRPKQFADLRSASAFPPFHDLPGDNDISLEHGASAYGLPYKPRRGQVFYCPDC